MSELADRIEGGLAGSVVGDAMGTPTETMTRRRVREVYGRLTDIVAPSKSPFSKARPAGKSSDDSSQMLMFADVLASNDGSLTIEDVVKTLLEWAEDEEMFRTGAGPTTRVAVAKLRDGADPFEVGLGDVHWGTGVSNGAAMKAAPAGWVHPGDIKNAVKTAALMAVPTHNTQIAISGAGAVAAAIAIAAAGGATVDDLVAAGIEGALQGEAVGLLQGREVAGPSVARRIAEAARIARDAGDIWHAMDELSDLIGSGLPTVEAVPAAFGMIVAAQGDVEQALVGAVNMGNDSDTVATIVGGITGTHSGITGVPARWTQLVETANEISLRPLAERMAAVTNSTASVKPHPHP